MELRCWLRLRLVPFGSVGCGDTHLQSDPSNYPVSARSPLSALVDNEKSKDGMDEIYEETGKTLKTLIEIFKNISPAY